MQLGAVVDHRRLGRRHRETKRQCISLHRRRRAVRSDPALRAGDVRIERDTGGADRGWRQPARASTGRSRLCGLPPSAAPATQSRNRSTPSAASGFRTRTSFAAAPPTRRRVRRRSSRLAPYESPGRHRRRSIAATRPSRPERSFRRSARSRRSPSGPLPAVSRCSGPMRAERRVVLQLDEDVRVVGLSEPPFEARAHARRRTGDARPSAGSITSRDLSYRSRNAPNSARCGVTSATPGWNTSIDLVRAEERRPVARRGVVRPCRRSG